MRFKLILLAMLCILLVGTFSSEAEIGGTVTIVDSTLNIHADFEGDWRAYGEVHNDTDEGIYYVKIGVVFRDSTYKIIGMDDTYAKGETVTLVTGSTQTDCIAPGKKGPFQILTYIDFEKVHSYEFTLSYRSNKIARPTMVESHRTSWGRIKASALEER